MVATATPRSVAVSCWPASACGTNAAAIDHERSLERVATRLIYLLLFLVPQVLIYLYLRERLPDPNQPNRGRVVRRALAGIFITLNIPWLLVGARVLFGGSVWSVGRLPLDRKSTRLNSSHQIISYA